MTPVLAQGRASWVAVALTAVMVAAACGASGDLGELADDPAASPQATTSAAPTAESTPTPAPEPTGAAQATPTSAEEQTEAPTAESFEPESGEPFQGRQVR